MFFSFSTRKKYAEVTVLSDDIFITNLKKIGDFEPSLVNKGKTIDLLSYQNF